MGGDGAHPHRPQSRLRLLQLVSQYRQAALSIRLEEGTAPTSLVDAAILATLESGETSPLTAAFLLPSHFVWLAKRNYDQKNYAESVRLSREALRGSSRLSMGGFIAAGRYMCLSASRMGDDFVFQEGMSKLEQAAPDDYSKSNIAYLKGFNYRLKGNLPLAEEHLKDAYKYSPGNLHASREIAAICLARGKLDEAENFAREAFSHGRTNPYLIDILISVLVRRYGKDSEHISEINELFDTLENVGEVGGRSFFTTRKAEFEYLWGDNKKALALITQATTRTPSIFETHRLRAEILLKDGKRSAALEEINLMRDIVNSRDEKGDRRSNYRGYLVTEAHYLQEVGQYEDAKRVYSERLVFTEAEKLAAIREIEIAQSYKSR